MGCGNSRSSVSTVASTTNATHVKPGSSTEANNNAQKSSSEEKKDAIVDAEGKEDGKPNQDERETPIGEEAVSKYSDPTSQQEETEPSDDKPAKDGFDDGFNEDKE
ncbi:uncharacterized protein LOC124452244 [Xenia sp. Carnegie-2017]|uniref:uncharacterized protein LOC124452244 n=1 Tax=Xenia sp. Carnegie-2017 TaxID=2897299 RepID=UPI001F049DE1|nr:uncharacterized protein LOC124452244 [Xenia sp. Carnegie-2017]